MGIGSVLAIPRQARLSLKKGIAPSESRCDLPVVVSFVDTDEHVGRVMPRLKQMAAHRLIVRENVVLEQGSLD